MNHVALGGAFVSLLLLAACQPDESLPRLSAPPPIDLTDPALGQESQYLRIHLAPGDTLAHTYFDTLSLRVTGLTAEGIVVEERLTEGSASQQGRPAVPFPDRIYRYRLSPKPTGLLVAPLDGPTLESRLFPHQEERAHELGYALKASASTTLAGLRPQVAYLPRHREFRLSSVAPEASVCVLAHGGRDQGLPGFTFVHARRGGLQFMLVEHDLAGEASGWLRID